MMTHEGVPDECGGFATSHLAPFVGRCILSAICMLHWHLTVQLVRIILFLIAFLLPLACGKRAHFLAV